MWSFMVHDLITGAPIGPIELDANQMGRKINDTDTGRSSFTIPPRMSRARLLDLTQPRSRVLVKRWDGAPRYAQVIQERKYDERNPTQFELVHEDLRGAIMARRTTFGSNGYSGNLDINNGLVITNTALISVPALLFWAGSEGPTSNYDLPVYLPEGKLTNALAHSLALAGTYTKTWWDYDGKVVDTAMREVQSLSGGPDVFYEPRYDGNGWLQWLMRIGDLSGTTTDFNMTAAKRKFFDGTWTENDLNSANVLYAFGNGSEQGKKVKTAQATPTLPAAERIVSYADEETDSILQSHADADLALWQKPTVQWSGSTFADVDLRVGGTIRLYHKDHPVHADGWTSTEMLGDSSDLTDHVTLDFQTIGGA